MLLRGRTMFDPTKWRVVGELTHTRSVCVGVAETGELTHTRSVCVGVAETRAEGGRHRLTDEAFINNLQ